MPWRNKLEQLVGLLEKVPQPQQFDAKTGVYEPYFVIELRSSNWEITPYANYTRLDGSPGREVRLSLAVLDSSKVNITQNELDCLIFLEADSNHNSRSIFAFAQPVGFLLAWLYKSTVFLKASASKPAQKIEMVADEGSIILQLRKTRGGYQLKPALVFENSPAIALEEPAQVITSNPIHLLYEGKIYRVSSALPAVFWHNYFRIRQQFEVPTSELREFIRLYLPHIAPVLDWRHLGDQVEVKTQGLTQKSISFSESNHHLNIDIRFKYGDADFPVYPPVKRSLAVSGKKLYVIHRDQKEEDRARHVLENHGLIFRGGAWQIAADYYPLDWMREAVPELEKAGFVIEDEAALNRFRVYRQAAKLHLKATTRKDGLKLDFQILLGKESVLVPDLLKQLNGDKSYLRLKNGGHIFLQPEMRQRLLELSRLLDLKEGIGESLLPRAGVTLLNALTGIVESSRLDTASKELLKRYRGFEKIEKTSPPQGLRGDLRPYQQSGLDWLIFLHEFRFGGILADDMGLGKTLQVISLLLKLKNEEKLKLPSLIVVPLTLIFNWEEEFAKFAPSIQVLRYHGSRSDRAKLLKQTDQYDAILCSYGVVLQDQRSLSQQKFGYLVLDESQKVKNPTTKTYKAIGRINAANKLALTGTPVENSMLDLWAQMNIVNPDLLGTLKKFQQRFIDISEDDQPRQIEILKKLIFPFILRRTKEEVEKQLPPLTEIVQHIEMTDSQRKQYQKQLLLFRDKLFREIDQNGVNKSRLKIVEALTYLRQISCHPAILDKTVALEDAGKMQLLENMLDDLIQEGHKILIFSQFVRFLTLVRQLFDKRGWTYEYLDGKVRNRAARIHNFQDNPDIFAFLISLKAGGVGLNLTAADYVIHLDPWWNPAVEQQATDRAHRIGQDKNVFVYKYIMKDSIEEKILQLQAHKKELSEALISSDGGFIKALSRSDLEVLFAPVDGE